uniref:Uncharacterized protein n=1 Tax=Arion vulgaris TaxID=1028688 RepID=A0A0B6Y8C9_9EUPU
MFRLYELLLDQRLFPSQKCYGARSIKKTYIHWHHLSRTFYQSCCVQPSGHICVLIVDHPSDR